MSKTPFGINDNELELKKQEILKIEGKEFLLESDIETYETKIIQLFETELGEPMETKVLFVSRSTNSNETLENHNRVKEYLLLNNRIPETNGGF